DAGAMLNKKKNIYFAAALILVAGLSLALSDGRDEEVVYSSLLWHCPYLDDESQCEVSFDLVNKTSAQQVRKVNVRGIRVSPGKNDESARICGQISFSILLEPREVMEIRELMPVVSMPDKIKVLIWK
ncbi:MAG: hypothetical protein JJV98_02645, partial [Desulfosarcina sp.]|nr:hypothetical protein [Desulfobacterales bacterium]